MSQSEDRHRRRSAPWFHRSNSRQELSTYLLGIALGIVLFAGLLSLSRGGTIAVALAVGTAAVTSAYASPSFRAVFAVLGATALLIAGSLSIFGYQYVAQRMDTVSSASLDAMDNNGKRREIWAAALQCIPQNPVFGSGVGSFVEFYPTQANAGAEWAVEFSHAENGYLQVAVETGLAGVVVLIAGIVLGMWWCIQSLRPHVPARLRLCAGAIAASLVASLFHSLTDFVWYVPACVATTVILAALLERVRQISDAPSKLPRTAPLPTFATAVAGVFLLMIGGWMVSELVGPAMAASFWNEYQMTVETLQAESRIAKQHGTLDAPTGHPKDAEDEERLISLLDRVLAWQPTHARAQMAMAEAHLRLFERLQATGPNPMSLLNLRNAVEQSSFPSYEATTEWLSRAAGFHWRHLELALHHLQNSLTSCPLQGRGYVYLSEVAFLEKHPHPPTQAYLQQALRVRPYDGTVLYAMGSEACLAGDTETWLKYSKQAFHSDRQQQMRLIGDLIGPLSGEAVPVMVDFIIRQFQPDLEAVRLLHWTSIPRCSPDLLKPLGRYHGDMARAEASRQAGPKAADLWREAYAQYHAIDDRHESLKSIRRAVECDPTNYEAHFQLGLRLLEQKLYTDAEEHLNWCRLRQPGDPLVEQKCRESLKGRLDAQLRTTADDPHNTTR
jgi:tetratricopeptide (TPR) repeat protein